MLTLFIVFRKYRATVALSTLEVIDMRSKSTRFERFRLENLNFQFSVHIALHSIQIENYITG